MRSDFDTVWERRKAWRAKCPLDDAELERRVLLAQGSGEWRTESGERRKGSGKFSIRPWAPIASAACLLLLLLPVGLRVQGKPSPEHVDIGGRQFYYVCNCGCPAEASLSVLQNIRQ